MATMLQKREFRKQFDKCHSGLFIFSDSRLLPTEIPEINIGQELSKSLTKLCPEERKDHALELMRIITDQYESFVISHMEILFTPSLQLNPVRLLQYLSRNRKICFVWPGEMSKKAISYSYPGEPEYFTDNPEELTDTYLILE